MKLLTTYCALFLCICTSMQCGKSTDALKNAAKIMEQFTLQHVTPQEYEENGKKLLKFCKAGNFAKILSLLGTGKVNVNFQFDPPFSKTPLYNASYNGHYNLVKYLTTQGADCYQKVNGDTPLHGAFYPFYCRVLTPFGHKQFFKIIKFFIEKKKMPIDIRGANGDTPLHLACFGGHGYLIEYLLQKKASQTLKNMHGATPRDQVGYAPLSLIRPALKILDKYKKQ